MGNLAAMILTLFNRLRIFYNVLNLNMLMELKDIGKLYKEIENVFSQIENIQK